MSNVYRLPTPGKGERVKVLFLDIDGVLNSTRFMVERAKAGTWESADPKDWTNMLDPIAVAILNRVVGATGCKIVISSSWRVAHPFDHIGLFMRKAGFVGEVIGQTAQYVRISSDVYGGRSVEIVSWLTDHPEVESFAIVDDGSDAGIGMESRFVDTWLSVGLTNEDADRLIEILNARARHEEAL